MIKKYLILLIGLCFFAAPAWAISSAIFGNMGQRSADPCGCSGTYLGCYTGDYSGDTDKICVNSGASSKDGTIVDATVTTAYVEFAAPDDYIRWAVVGNDLIDPDEGTMYFTLYVVDEGNADVDENPLIEVHADVNNLIYIWTDDGTDKIRVSYKGNNVADFNLFSADVVVLDSWRRVGYAWHQGEAGNDHACSCVAAGNAPNWSENDDDLTLWTTQPTEVQIGESDQSRAVSDSAIRIKDLIILPTYKAADPL